jgi:hypothetical protein
MDAANLPVGGYNRYRRRKFSFLQKNLFAGFVHLTLFDACHELLYGREVFLFMANGV